MSTGKRRDSKSPKSSAYKASNSTGVYWLCGEMGTVLQQWKAQRRKDRKLKVILDSTLLLSFEKASSRTEAIYSVTHLFTRTPLSLCLYLNVVRSKPAGVLLAAQGQDVEIHQHSKIPTL